jgi:hypothetical protein
MERHSVHHAVAIKPAQHGGVQRRFLVVACWAERSSSSNHVSSQCALLFRLAMQV